MSLAHPFQPAKLLYHRREIEQMLKGELTAAPINLEWDLSNVCPHDCPFCSFGTSESQGYRQQNYQHFPAERAFALVPELAAAGVQAVTFTGGGEPLVHPKAADIMTAVHEAGIQFGLVTNGFLLRDRVGELVADRARFVRVSLDAGRAESHTKLHRPPQPQFDQIVRNMAAVISRAAKTNSGLMVGASFCVTDDNWQEIGIAAGMLRAMGASYLEVRPTFPTEWRGDGWGMALSNVSNAQRTLADVKAEFDSDGFKVIGMIERFESLNAPAKRYSACRIGPLMAVLGADGRLWHCCIQRGQEAFALGSVIDAPFADAWRAAQAKRLGDDIDVKKCPRCRYDNYNELLEAVDSDRLHIAFV